MNHDDKHLHAAKGDEIRAARLRSIALRLSTGQYAVNYQLLATRLLDSGVFARQ